MLVRATLAGQVDPGALEASVRIATRAFTGVKVTVAATEPRAWSLVLELTSPAGGAVLVPSMMAEVVAGYRAGAPATATADAARGAEWQRADDSSAATEAGADEPARCLELPADAPDGKEASFAPAKRSVSLPEGVHDRLRASFGAAIHPVLAACCVVVARLVGEPQVAVHFETSHLMRAVRRALVASLADDPVFSDFVTRLQKGSREPTTTQREGRKLFLSVAREPAELVADSFTLDYAVEYQRTSVGAFEISIFGASSNPTMTIHYDANKYHPDHVENVAEQIAYLLEQVGGAPGQRVSDYSLLTPRARELLPDASVRLEEPRYDLVHECIDHWVKELPGGTAIHTPEREATYEDLGKSMAAIRTRFNAAGLSAGGVIAVTGTKSFGLMAAVAAVITSGGVLLTLDPNLPIKRRVVMLREARARGLVCIGDITDSDRSAYAELGVSVIEVPTNENSLPLEGVSVTPLRTPSPDDPAYVFFTSGTTGTAKGVLGCHKGLAHFLAWQRSTFSVSPDDRCGQLTALSFDVVLRDIFLPLTSGAALCLPPNDIPGERTLDWLERERITLLHSVPARGESWLALGASNISLRSIRIVFFAGEALKSAFVHRWRKAFPEQGAIVNLYGPTETTLAKAFFPVPAEITSGIQPVGRLQPQTQAIVRSPSGRQCGFGEAGEICIRTPFRTLGYINAPEEQEKKFIRNDATDDPKDLLYRTGDLGRYRHDGVLEIMGRIDEEMKVRGVRIDPAEIEAPLLRCPAVGGAVVVAVDDTAAGKRLVAYVSPVKGSSVDERELIRMLRLELPEIMVPSQIVVLASIPLTVNGKVDRRSLPAPERIEAAGPRTDAERGLAAIWSELLKVERIGRTDNFFALGGDSLMAMEMMSRLQETMDVSLSVASFLDDPTLAGVALQITSAADSAPLPDIGRSGATRAPLSYPQAWLWHWEKAHPGTPTWNCFRAYRIRGPLERDVMTRTLRDVVRRQQSLRTTFPAAADGAPTQVIAPPPELDIRVVDLRSTPAAEREAVARRGVSDEVHSIFDLEKGPPFAAALFVLDDEDQILTLRAHHIVTDRDGVGILLDEVLATYDAFVAGASGPADPPAQYVDFALWHHDLVKSPAAQEDLSRLVGALHGARPLAFSVQNAPQALVSSKAAEVHSFPISADLLERVDAVVRSEATTRFMAIITILNMVALQGGTTDVLIAAPSHANRQRSPKLARLVGHFGNHLFVRVKSQAGCTPRDVLRGVRASVAEAYRHGAAPASLILGCDSVFDHPFMRVLVNLDLARESISSRSGIAVEDYSVPPRFGAGGIAPRGHLVFHVSEGARGELRVNMLAAPEVYDAAALKRLEVAFTSALRVLADEPDAPVPVTTA